MTTKRKKQAKLIRTFRKVHRTMGIFLFAFFFIISVSGLLLGWKKHSGDFIAPRNYQGSSKDLSNWLPIKQLAENAHNHLLININPTPSLELDRIDVRADKGIAKFIYKNHYWSVQVDGATGQVLYLGKRNSDLFESIHDGSILDNYFGNSNGQIKLVYTTTMGLALFLFTVSGFWIWYGPRRMRK